ncbi:hypothetical protein D0T57_02620 [Dysgonomonas sp. 511]|nr:hypothetical protein [Dysgonomonas sp. 511]
MHCSYPIGITNGAKINNTAKVVKNMNQEAIKAKIISKPSLAETLRSLTIGKPSTIKSNQFKTNSVRNTISRLKKKGFDFDATEEGLVDEIRVTRLK